MQPDNRTLDPGRVQENKLDSTYSLLRTAVVSTIDVSEENDMEESSRTELDSHDNMPVVGRNAYIISDTGRVAGDARLRFQTNQRKVCQCTAVEGASAHMNFDLTLTL
jgi:hypothetical protein